MILVPLKVLQPGMVVAQSVDTNVAGKLGLTLLGQGTKLTPFLIDALKRHNIPAVYIEKEGTEDIKAQEIIGEKLKGETLFQIKSTFETFATKNNKLIAKMLGETVNIAEQLVESIVSNKDVMVSLVNLKNHDDYTYTHSLCVALVSITVGQSLGYDRETLKQLSVAALLHDIGKVDISSAIINKPSKLSESEFGEIKKHPQYGRDIVQKCDFTVSMAALNAIKGHHEKYDGTGYPQGIKGNEIGEFSKIIAIADVYDALTSERSYRKASQPNEAIEYIMACASTHFDINIVGHFLKKIVAFPVGSFVFLSNGMSAIVVQNNPENIMRPIVRVLTDVGVPGYDLDLFRDTAALNITIIGSQDDD